MAKNKIHNLITDCLMVTGNYKSWYVVRDLFDGEIIATKPDIHSKKVLKNLSEARSCFKEAQNERNKHLEAIYKDDLKKPKEYRVYISLLHFIAYFKDYIYTREQLVSLLTKFEEVKNPMQKSYYIGKRFSMEYLSQEDLDNAINELTK